MIPRTALLTALLCASSNAFTPSRIQSTHTHTTTTTSTQINSSTNSAHPMPLAQGSTVALITPFHPETGKINEQSLRSLLQYHLTSNTDGLCILGTTAEASLMSMAERKILLDIVTSEIKGRIPFMVGTGAINPMEVREMTLQAMDHGADAALVVCPPYIKPPQRGLVKHFTKVAELGLPVVLYNVPGRTAVDLTPETIGLCMEMHEGIIGVKEATGDVSRVGKIRNVEEEVRIRSGCDRKLLLYSGDDATEAEFVMEGGDGCISVTANVAAKEMHEMMMLALGGKENEEEVMRINDLLKDLHMDIFCESNPIPAKWAAKRLGMIESAYCREPLMELDEQYYGKVEAALRKAGLL